MTKLRRKQLLLLVMREEFVLIVLAIDTAGTTTVRDIREFIHLMRLYCGGGLAGITVYFPVCSPRPSAGMLAGHYFELDKMYLHIYVVYVYSWRVTAP